MLDYPIAFEPIFKSMIWGGNRLPKFLGKKTDVPDPIGEAWVLSDVSGNSSVVQNGPLAGKSLRYLMETNARELFGTSVPDDGRFPLLLKFIDARRELSVQVHPNDEQAVRLEGPNKRGKTEAWVILDADSKTSKIYAGFAEGIDEAAFRQAMADNQTATALHSFVTEPGDAVFLKAGTVHAIGAEILLFEVQQTSDITYRLYDWDRVDPKTGLARELHLEKALACSNFEAGPVPPIRSATGCLEIACEYFSLRGHQVSMSQNLETSGRCSLVVGISGQGEIVWPRGREPFVSGSVFLLPSILESCQMVPKSESKFLTIELGNKS